MGNQALFWLAGLKGKEGEAEDRKEAISAMMQSLIERKANARASNKSPERADETKNAWEIMKIHGFSLIFDEKPWIFMIS